MRPGQESSVLDVIVLNWNGKNVIGECIESLKAVEGQRLRITVVDNGSTDGSVGMIREKFPEVKLIVNDENLLFAEGNNVGLRDAMAAGGEYFLLLNNDTVVDRDFAVEMMRGLDVEGVGIVGAKIYYHDDPHRIWYGGGGFYPLLWLPRHDGIRKLDDEISAKPGVTGWVTGCAMLFSRKVLEDTGMLDRSYRIYCEDVDFCLRARRAGWKCFYQPSARIWHKVSSSSGGGFTPFKLENRIVSTARLFAIHRSLWWRAALFPLHLAGMVVLLAVLAVTGKKGLLAGAARGIARIVKGR